MGKIVHNNILFYLNIDFLFSIAISPFVFTGVTKPFAGKGRIVVYAY